MRRIAVFVVLAALAMFAADKKVTTVPVAPEPTKADVNSFLQHYMGWDPTAKWEVNDIRPSNIPGLTEVTATVEGRGVISLMITPDGKHAFLSQPIPFGADPFAADRAILQKEAVGPSRGPANSPITIVEFGDLQCPYCKAAQPTIDKLLTDTNARLIFQEFPLPQHDWAMKAAKYAECVAQEKPSIEFKYIQAVYDYQAEINAQNADDRLKTLASQAGVDGNAVQQCTAQEGITYRIEHSMQLGKKVGVNATPTLIVNGNMLTSINQIPYETLKQIVEYMGKISPTGATGATQ